MIVKEGDAYGQAGIFENELGCLVFVNELVQAIRR